jgi:hypothetical protein
VISSKVAFDSISLVVSRVVLYRVVGGYVPYRISISIFYGRYKTYAVSIIIYPDSSFFFLNVIYPDSSSTYSNALSFCHAAVYQFTLTLNFV